MKKNLNTAIDFIKQHPKLVAADDYEIVCQKRDSKYHHFKNGEMTSRTKNSFCWAQIRVLHRKRLGVASTVFYQDRDLLGMVDRAFDLADNMESDPWFRFPLWKPTNPISSEMPGQKEAGLSFNSGFTETVYPNLLSLPIGLEEKYLEQQDSRLIVRKTEKFSRSFSVELQKFQFGVVNQGANGFYQVEDSRGFSRTTIQKEKCLEALLRRANRLSSAKRPNLAGREKYILNGLVVANLLRNIESDLNGGLAVLGKSRCSNQIDRQIFSDKVTIIDDGKYIGGEGSQEFDFEGVPSQETTLVKSGVLKTFLHDASTAARFNRITTANSVFNDMGVSAIGVTNCYLEPSKFSPDALFKEMGDGIYLESLERLGKDLTQGGKLELLGHGWRVERGEPVEPFTHLFIVVDPFEILKEIRMVANDLEFWGRYGAPSVFLENMPLSQI